ncbi:hypothetical protein ACFPOI_28820 [Nonomuraea angiospora]|uniref:Uncharacterized protein n=1 Tax=Nonomuraea angiospora TaxID=46172 RepID=A0ABR9LTV0_9ACTN|nr:hypothetical protein [Nonomuraea angiospora]MBE1584071.1 hypothetical protein [Nonomuraea angiospora]
MTAGWLRVSYSTVGSFLTVATLVMLPAHAEPKPTAEQLGRLQKDFDRAAAGHNANLAALAAAQRAEKEAATG